jgi:hypothetical protein
VEAVKSTEKQPERTDLRRWARYLHIPVPSAHTPTGSSPGSPHLASDQYHVLWVSNTLYEVPRAKPEILPGRFGVVYNFAQAESPNVVREVGVLLMPRTWYITRAELKDLLRLH